MYGVSIDRHEIFKRSNTIQNQKKEVSVYGKTIHLKR